MTAFLRFYDNLKRFGLEYFGLYYGVYRGTVASVVDGDQGKLEIIVPGTGKTSEPLSAPAYPMTAFAGAGYGMYMLPEPGDTVWVMFERGSLRFPIWTGGWYGKDELPADFAGKAQRARGFVTPAGHKVVLDDDENKIIVSVKHSDSEFSFMSITEEGEIVIQTKHGETVYLSELGISLIDGTNQHAFAMDAEGAKLVTADGHMLFLAKNGGVVLMSGGDLNITAGGVVNIDGGNCNLLGSSEPAVLGKKALSWLLSHTHVGNMGAPTPLDPAAAAQAAKILSTKVKVG